MRRPDRLGTDLPGWLFAIVTSMAAAVAGFGIAGLVAAMAGRFQPAIVWPAGACITAALIVLIRPWPLPRATLVGHLWAVVVVVVVVAVSVLNAVSHGEHIRSTRDPAIYTLTARWLERDEGLRVPAAVGPFATDTRVDPASSLGFFADGDHLAPQFVHLWPAALGEAGWLGGDRLMLVAPALVGGLALLALYLVGAQLIAPWAAAGATVAIAASLPQAFFSRDGYSEVPLQALVLTALALVLASRPSRRSGPALAAGVLLGVAFAVRVDALLLIAPLPLWAAAQWLGTRDAKERHDVAWYVAALLGGVAVGALLGGVDLVVFSRPYLRLQRSEMASQAALVVASSVAAAAAVVIGARWTRWRAWFAAVRARLAGLSALVLVGVAAFAWFARPSLEKTIEGPSPSIAFLQRAFGQAVEPARRYYEDSLRWHAWYLGPVGLAAGIAGIALATLVVVRGRPRTDDRRASFALPLVMFAVPTVLYVWRARAFPDQPWVMRRFLPLTLPGFALAAFGLVEAMVVWQRRWGARRPRAEGFAMELAGAVIGVMVVLAPAKALQPVRDTTPERGMLAAVETICRAAGPDGAVVVLRQDDLDQLLPQTVRSYCGLPAAGARDGFDAAAARDLDRQWQAQGRRLVVVAADAAGVVAVVPSGTPTIVTFTNRRELPQTLLGRPDATIAAPYRMAIQRMD